ncbi:zinc-binding dehydrogenase [Arthrobacter sp. ISL-85]|uniref:zinc-binding dehydrogenase n=1 Tax=Arthrobacter sp. ISL-85 TaxID=2819115 RepID=UPI001BEB0E90|nr:zinc-binding dehydrogenase [Arthrobacter sp. ISL-85]MBT2566329.1 zinc-binding dehydrogenase [Arthrobacter sp. ISL-85]
MGLTEAATLPMNGLTAQVALEALGAEHGGTIAVTGAAGALGGYTVQLAKAAGLRVIADSSKKDEVLVRSLGADELVPRGSGVADHILALAPGGVAGLMDASVQQNEVVPAIRPDGVLVEVRAWEGSPVHGIEQRTVSVTQAESPADIQEILVKGQGSRVKGQGSRATVHGWVVVDHSFFPVARWCPWLAPRT